MDAFTLDGLMPLFYPSGYSPADRAHTHAQTLSRLSDPVFHHMLVVDTDLEPLPQDLVGLPSSAGVVGPADLETIARSTDGRVVGISIWKIYERERSAEELAADEQKAAREPLPPTADAAFLAAFFGAVGAAKKELLGGRPYVLLHMLGTDPAHHRRGVGSLGLQWGLAQADRLGVEAYLEASEMGRPLYARWGFEEVRRLEFDARDFGADKEMRHTIMRRPARKV